MISETMENMSFFSLTFLFYSCISLLQWQSMVLWLMQLWSGIPLHSAWRHIASTVIFHFYTGISLLQLHSTFTVALHSYSGIVADAALKCNTIFAALRNVSFVLTLVLFYWTNSFTAWVSKNAWCRNKKCRLSVTWLRWSMLLCKCPVEGLWKCFVKGPGKSLIEGSWKCPVAGPWKSLVEGPWNATLKGDAHLILDYLLHGWM